MAENPLAHHRANGRTGGNSRARGFAAGGRNGVSFRIDPSTPPKMRENIYLNGAILEMKRKEIERLFDEIAAFGEEE